MMQRKHEGLPSWMVGPSFYEPPKDRDGYLRKNILALISALNVLRAQGAPDNALDRILLRVPAPMRLLSLIVLVLLCSLARNMAFVWVLLAIELALLCVRPPTTIAQIVVPALGATLIAILVNLPAAIFFGQTAAPVRVGSKTLVNLMLVGSVARTTTPEDLLGGLPRAISVTIGMTIRDLVLIGAEATNLSEALELRSVGKNRNKTQGVAGVLGTCFLRAGRHAQEQADAMRLRGFDDTSPTTSNWLTLNSTVALYLVAIAFIFALFIYLEASL